MAFRFASGLWGRREGYWAAGLLAFSLIFYLPAGDHSAGTGHVDDLAASGGGLFGMAAKTAGCRPGRGPRVRDEHQGSAVLLVCLIFAPAAWPLFALVARRILDPERAASGMAGLAARIFGLCGKRLALGTFVCRRAAGRFACRKRPDPRLGTGSDSTLRWLSPPRGTGSGRKIAACAARMLAWAVDFAGRRRRGLAIFAALSQPDAAALGDRGSSRRLHPGARNARFAAASSEPAPWWRPLWSR